MMDQFPTDGPPSPAMPPVDSGEMPQAVLEGRRVRLRPVAPQDYEWLFQLNSRPELAHRWRGRPGSLNPAQVADYLWNNVYCQFVISRKRDGRPVGLVVAYGADLPNRTVRFGIVLDPEFHAVGWPLEAAPLFIDYLFQTGDFRKLYAEAVDYNIQSYESALDRGIVQLEGRLKEHVYSAGSYRDYYMFAIYRDEWTTRRARGRAVRRANLS
jgi:RimJ/RimL family protein N-acetyltransferase